MKVSFNESAFKKMTLTEVRKAYKSQKAVLPLAEKFWRKTNKKGAV